MTKQEKATTTSETEMTETFTPRAEEPESTRVDWSKRLEPVHANPGTWFLIAEDVAGSIPSYLQRKYGVQVRSSGVNGTRIAKIYARTKSPIVQPS